jgi:hypothetical protein
MTRRIRSFIIFTVFVFAFFCTKTQSLELPLGRSQGGSHSCLMAAALHLSRT